MDYIVKNQDEFSRALKGANEGDSIIISGRINLSDAVKLKNAKGISFIGQNDAALDFMQPVRGFVETTENGVRVFAADIPSELAKLKPYAAFAADGKMLNRPRLPKTGFYNVKGSPDFDMFATNQYARQDAMIYGEGEVPVMKYPKVAQVRAFHYWTDELCYVESVDYENRVIRLKNQPLFSMVRENSRTEGARWYLDNVFEALDTPSEYYITPDCGKLYYVPFDGESADDLTIYLSTSESLLELDGCSNISFEGIEFKGSDRDKLHILRSHSQAASDIPCAVEIDDSADILFRNCRFADIGLSCVGIDNGSHDITVEGCEFAGIGGNPVYIKGRNLKQSDWRTTYPNGKQVNNVEPDIQHKIKIVGNHIHDYGRVYMNACGIVLRYAYDCDLSDNHIHDGYYTGISCGWVWGYAAHATNHVRIERNHIHDIGKTLLSDMGGIYTLGHQEGTVIRGNRIHNIEMDSYGGWGVYLDEGSSDILVEDNIAYDLTAQPFHQHYGANNLVRRNIFAFGEGGAFIVTRKGEHLSVILERNILVSDGSAIYAKPAEGFHITDCMNLVWNYAGEALSGQMNFDVYKREYSFPKENQRTPEQMKAGGLFNGVIVADPKFRDVKARDFTLADDSPAKALGF